MSLDFNKVYTRISFVCTLGVLSGWGVTCTNSTNVYTATSYVSGTLTIAEGIYYLDDYMVGSKTQNNYCTSRIPDPFIQCPWDDFNLFTDDPFYTSLRRFNYGIRPKFIVDDTASPPPIEIKDIPQQTPIAGQKSMLQLTPITDY